MTKLKFWRKCIFLFDNEVSASISRRIRDITYIGRLVYAKPCRKAFKKSILVSNVGGAEHRPPGARPSPRGGSAPRGVRLRRKPLRCVFGKWKIKFDWKGCGNDSRLKLWTKFGTGAEKKWRNWNFDENAFFSKFDQNFNQKRRKIVDF